MLNRSIRKAEKFAQKIECLFRAVRRLSKRFRRAVADMLLNGVILLGLWALVKWFFHP